MSDPLDVSSLSAEERPIEPGRLERFERLRHAASRWEKLCEASERWKTIAAGLTPEQAMALGAVGLVHAMAASGGGSCCDAERFAGLVWDLYVDALEGYDEPRVCICGHDLHRKRCLHAGCSCSWEEVL